MLKVLITFHFLIFITLILLVLLQKSGEEGSLFSKANQNRVDRADSNIIKITMFFIGLFILNSISILYIQNKKNTSKQEVETPIQKMEKNLTDNL
jgi:protein translocase SecG subunit